MRSRRLPGQRPTNDPGSGIRRPPPPPEPAPLPAEVYFDEQSRKAAAKVNRAEDRTVEPRAAEAAPATVAGMAETYGARAATIIWMLLQVSVALVMLPRIINAAEALLVNPKQLIVLAILGIVELAMAVWGFVTRSAFGAGACVALGIAWWIYLLLQVFA